MVFCLGVDALTLDRAKIHEPEDLPFVRRIQGEIISFRAGFKLHTSFRPFSLKASLSRRRCLATDSGMIRGSNVTHSEMIEKAGEPFKEPVRLPIDEFLDLHAVAPKEIPSVVEEYLMQCRAAGLLEVRLIHGKGIGAQRAVVRRLLRTLPGIVSFADAPPEAGGWGATVVMLRPSEG